MNWLLALFFSLAIAAPNEGPVINQVLFYESKQSWTSRDLELFNHIKKEVLKKSRLSQLADTDHEDFLLSRLAAREAILFEVTSVKIRLADTQKQSLQNFSNKEIDEELAQVGRALTLIELKESQLNQKMRFKTWFDLLKRKYQVKIKAADFKT